MSNFESNYNGAELKNNDNEDYVFHNVDIFGSIVLLGEEFNLTYQCGNSFINGDYSCPSPSLSLTRSLNSDFICEMDALTEDEIENFTEENIKFYSSMFPNVKSLDDLLEIHSDLNESLIVGANNEFESLKSRLFVSDNPFVYICDEGEIYARFKTADDASNLSELIDILTALDEEADSKGLSSDVYYDSTSLPCFGSEPKCTLDIYSWDDSEVLLNGTTLENPGWYTEKRCPICKEATFNCDHDV